MEITVEGEPITDRELNDGTWISTALKNQKRFRRPGASKEDEGSASGSAVVAAPGMGYEAAATTGSHECMNNKGKPFDSTAKRSRPPPRRRRPPIPRLPADHYKIVIRPQSALDLPAHGGALLLEALRLAANITDGNTHSEDILQKHPVNRTFTISTPSEKRANAYLNLQELVIEGRKCPIKAYAPAPDLSVKGLIHNEYCGETDEQLVQNYNSYNPDWIVTSARRYGKTNHIMITVAGTELPRLLRYPGTRHKVVLLLNRVEACFNCRKTGHRQDVCPQKRRNLCFRCGEEHPPPQEGQPTTCAPVCIICARAHKTGSSNCKFRFAKQQASQRPNPLSNPDLNIGQNFKHQSRDRNRQHETLTRGDKREASSSFPPLLRSRSKSATRSSQSRDRQKDQQRSSSKRRDPKNPWTKPGERAIKWQEDPEKQALRNQVREQAIVIERMQSQISVLGNKIASLTQTQHPGESATTTNNTCRSLTPSEGAVMEVESTNVLKRQASKDQQDAQNPKRRIETASASQAASTFAVKAKLALEQKERLNKVEARADRLEATSMDVVKNLQQTKEEMMEAIKALQVQVSTIATAVAQLTVPQHGSP